MVADKRFGLFSSLVFRVNNLKILVFGSTILDKRHSNSIAGIILGDARNTIVVESIVVLGSLAMARIAIELDSHQTI